MNMLDSVFVWYPLLHLSLSIRKKLSHGELAQLLGVWGGRVEIRF